MLRNHSQQTAVDRAVSPVVGVVLLVGITVILAAVVGGAILGVADQTIQTPGGDEPDAEFVFIESGDSLDVTHSGGDTIPADELVVDVGVETQQWDRYGTVEKGDTLTVDTPAANETVYVLWRTIDGEVLLDRYDA